jgi:cell division protein FtsB
MLKRFTQFLQTFVVRAVAIVILIAAFQYVFNAESRVRHDSLRDELERMQNENRKLVDEIEYLRLQVGAIKTDERYLEKMARQEFGMIKKDEQIYRFIPRSTH